MPCCVPSCTSTEGHPFPKDPVIRTKWLTAMGRRKMGVLWEPTNEDLVCYKHFQENCFETLFDDAPEKRKLTWCAVPSIFNTNEEMVPEEMVAADEVVQKETPEETEFTTGEIPSLEGTVSETEPSVSNDTPISCAEIISGTDGKVDATESGEKTTESDLDESTALAALEEATGSADLTTESVEDFSLEPDLLESAMAALHSSPPREEASVGSPMVENEEENMVENDAEEENKSSSKLKDTLAKAIDEIGGLLPSEERNQSSDDVLEMPEQSKGEPSKNGSPEDDSSDDVLELPLEQPEGKPSKNESSEGEKSLDDTLESPPEQSKGEPSKNESSKGEPSKEQQTKKATMTFSPQDKPKPKSNANIPKYRNILPKPNCSVLPMSIKISAIASSAGVSEANESGDLQLSPYNSDTESSPDLDLLVEDGDVKSEPASDPPYSPDDDIEEEDDLVQIKAEVSSPVPESRTPALIPNIKSKTILPTSRSRKRKVPQKLRDPDFEFDRSGIPVPEIDENNHPYVKLQKIRLVDPTVLLTDEAVKNLNLDRAEVQRSPKKKSNTRERKQKLAERAMDDDTATAKPKKLVVPRLLPTTTETDAETSYKDPSSPPSDISGLSDDGSIFEPAADDRGDLTSDDDEPSPEDVKNCILARPTRRFEPRVPELSYELVYEEDITSHPDTIRHHDAKGYTDHVLEKFDNVEIIEIDGQEHEDKTTFEAFECRSCFKNYCSEHDLWRHFQYDHVNASEKCHLVYGNFDFNLLSTTP